VRETLASVEVAPTELGEALAAVRLCVPEGQQQMQQSLSKLGQLTPVQAFRVGSGLQLFDGLKRMRAARELSWPRLRVEVHVLDSAGAKARLLRCNAGTGLSELEEAWVVRSLYREDKLNQGQISVLLGCHKSWVCRRLALAENLSDRVTASVRLGLLSATACRELVRLPRGNQDAAAQVVMHRGLTSRQTTQLVEQLLTSPQEQWPSMLEQAALPAALPAKGGAPRRSPGEQMVAEVWAMKRLASRLHVRLLERPLASLGEPACGVVARELTELQKVLFALTRTLDARLCPQGATDGGA
jgi:ParB-like chromosome segregation protein Spo0J